MTRRLTKQDKIRYRLDIRLDIRLCLYIDTHSRLPIITTCFVQLPACSLVAIPSSHHSHCRIGLLHHHNERQQQTDGKIRTCAERLGFDHGNPSTGFFSLFSFLFSLFSLLVLSFFANLRFIFFTNFNPRWWRPPSNSITSLYVSSKISPSHLWQRFSQYPI